MVIAIVVVCLVVGAYLWMRKTRTSLVWFSATGFSAQQFHERPTHRSASPEQVRTAIAALLVAEAFDTLVISAGPDPDAEGVGFDSIYGNLRISMQFLVAKDSELKARCKVAFAEMGFDDPLEEPWNEGLGPQLEMVTLSYRIAEDATLIYDVAETALKARTGTGPESRFLSAVKLNDFPDRKVGPALVRFRDPLDDVLGPREEG